MTDRHHPNAETLLNGTDWQLMRDDESARVNAVYARAQAQWFKEARNEREANMQMQGFKPPFRKHEEVEPEILTPGRMLVGCAVFLAVCVLAAMAALYLWR